MALVLKDRVKETTTTSGTGTVTLAGAATGFQSFAAVGDGNETYYAIVDAATGDWEVGIGVYTASGTTLSRATVLSSSNAGSLVNFGSGTKDVFVTYPSSRSVYQNTTGTVTVQNEFQTINADTINVSTANITAGTVTTTPTTGNDLVNKTYVDTMVSSGITYHAPVKYEVPSTTGNLTATYDNGTAGVGATLTNAGTLGAFTPDGVVASVNDRILIYNQTNQFENGVYTVTTVGDGSTPWVLTRATDADTYGVKSPNSLGQGDAFFVTSGNTGAGETYECNTVGTITFGTTAITFVQISSAQVYSAGTGLTLTGTQFSITSTGVSAATYGSASSVPVIAFNAQGQATSVTDTPIAISGSAVSGDITGKSGGTTAALTAGAFLNSAGTFDGSTARTFDVNADSANTASTVVARDASGNFSAGTITATLSGSATSAGTATNIAGGAANQIVYQTGAGATGFASAPTLSGQLLSWNGSAFAWAAPGSPGITYVAVTTNYTAAANEGVLTDTSGGAFTVTLPAAPATGAQVVIADAGGAWGTNNLTVGRNGSTIVGLAENMLLDISGASVQFVYDGTTWEVYAQVGGNGGSVVTLDATQTLTNKTLTSPIITENVQVIGTNTNAAVSRTYVFTASLTLTLPSSPAAGDWVAFSNFSNTTTCVIGRNGSNIMGLAEDMTVDNVSYFATLVYADATRGWIFQ